MPQLFEGSVGGLLQGQISAPIQHTLIFSECLNFPYLISIVLYQNNLFCNKICIVLCFKQKGFIVPNWVLYLNMIFVAFRIVWVYINFPSFFEVCSKLKRGIKMIYASKFRADISHSKSFLTVQNVILLKPKALYSSEAVSNRRKPKGGG